VGLRTGAAQASTARWSARESVIHVFIRAHMSYSFSSAFAADSSQEFLSSEVARANYR
jgi:hypothetical protein